MILEISRGYLKIQVANKVATIQGEMFFPGGGKLGFVLYRNSLKHWDLPHENQVLTEEEVQMVIDEIEAEFSRKGHMLDVEK